MKKTILPNLFCIGLFLIIILSLSFIPIVSAMPTPKGIIFVKLNYNDDILTPVEMLSGEGFIPEFGEGALKLEKCSVDVFSPSGKQLYSSMFEIPDKILYNILDEKTGEFTGGGIKELNDFDFMVTIPYFKNMDQIEIVCEKGDKNIILNSKEFDKLKKADVPSFEKEKKDSEKKNSKVESIENNNLKDKPKKDSFMIVFVEFLNSIFYYLFK